MSEPARPRGGAGRPTRRIILWFSGAMSAAAAILLATVLLLYRGQPPANEQTPIAERPAEQSIAAVGPVVRIGLSADDARKLVVQPAADADAVVVVFPRQADVPQAGAVSQPSPLVVSDRTRFSGTPRRAWSQDDADVVFASF